MNKYLLSILLILVIGIIPASAWSLASTTVSNNHIYKCQPSTVTATFNDPGFIISYVYLYTTTSALGSPTHETYQMTWDFMHTWTYTYGNDNTTPWGNKSIGFIVNDAWGDNYTNTTNNYIFVYSDDCIGTGITNVSQGFGHYTNKLFETNASLMNVSIMPFTDSLGSFFYLIVLLIMCLVLYLKTANIMVPLAFGIVGAILVISNLTLADQYLGFVKLLGAAIFAGLLWKVFKS